MTEIKKLPSIPQKRSVSFATVLGEENGLVKRFPFEPQMAENIKKATESIYYEAVTIQDSNESKTVPDNALPYAKLTMLGGMTSVEGVFASEGIQNIACGNIEVPIPKAIQNLPDYGHGAGEGYNNTVDLVNKKYIQRCAVAKFNTAFTHGDWTMVNSLTFAFPAEDYAIWEAALKTIKCSYQGISFELIDVQEIEGIQDCGLAIKINGESPTESDLQALIDEQETMGLPITVVYGLAEPIETDISEDVPDIYIDISGDSKVYFEGNIYENIETGVEFYIKKDTKAEKSYVNGTAANAVKGTLMGSAVEATDVSPLEHELGIKVRSKNFIPFPYLSGSATVAGVTITVNDDGSVTFDGTASDSVRFILAKTPMLDLIPNQTYIASISASSEDTPVKLEVISYSASGAYSAVYNKSFFLAEKEFVSSITLTVASGGVCNNITVRPMVELGDTSTDYVRQSSLEGVAVTYRGKNLLNSDVLDIANWTYDSTARRYRYALELPAGTYKPYIEIENSNMYLYFVFSTDGGATWTEKWVNCISAERGARNEIKITVNEGEKWALSISDINGIKNVKKLQLEKGDTFTGYEPYFAPVTAIADTDGNVVGVKTFAPSMSLTTDRENTVIYCEYNRDANKVITDLETKLNTLIAAIGG